MTSPIHWGASTLEERGAIIPVNGDIHKGNAVGEHGGLWGTHILAAKAAKRIAFGHRPDLEGFTQAVDIPPNKNWFNPDAIVSMDPWGHKAHEVGAFPTIAITEGNYHNWWIHRLLDQGKLEPDGKVLKEDGTYNVTEIAADQVWHLPGVSQRLDVNGRRMRAILGERYHQLRKRPDINVLLPAMAWIRGHVFGDIQKLFDSGDHHVPVTARIHDYCGDGDAGSTRCSCAAYREFAVEECIKSAQQGGVGILFEQGYEGCGAGPVAKHIIYRLRAKNPDGDTDDHYYSMRMRVVGAADPRLHEFYGDPLLFLGVNHVDRWVSMSRDKVNALQSVGITIGEQIALPDDRIPDGARVEIGAKTKHGGYFTNGTNGHSKHDFDAGVDA